MATLNRELRKTLEKVVAEARDMAEDAAAKALDALAVGEREPYRSMTVEQKALRNRLRAHSRQLGDSRNAEKGTQELDRLVAECAHEHWHRMLFARFLAENQLLLEPESGVAIAIGEVKEMARARAKDWVVLAGEFAVQMLPQVFRQDDPALEVEFAPEDRKRLEELVEALSDGVFTASDSLGWTYQFWQAERKDAINASGAKIGAEELPAVTQLFTEDYMVDFLLDNTLGAWHAGKVLAANPKLGETANSEDEVRQMVALPECPWRYLRFIKREDDTWTPAAGPFDGWPKTAKELKCIDPCMGSGHFVVALFERLVALRLAEEALGEANAVAAVIRDNLFGLEIDPRCTQIGAFNLALAAWRRVGHCALPAMNLACSGLAPNTREADWLSIANDNEKLRNGMERLYRLFQKAAVLGSLINPRASEGDLLEAGFDEIQPLLEKALARETKDDTAHEMAVTARGLAKVAGILAGHFTLVATNVPYLARGKQVEFLMDYCETNYYEAKADLSTCFVQRSLAFCNSIGSIALVTPQNWLFQPAYEQLRQDLLKETRWDFVGRLGPKGFQTPMWDFNIVLLGLASQRPPENHQFAGLDVSEAGSPFEKSAALRTGSIVSVTQKRQLANPEARIALEDNDSVELLSVFAHGVHGLGSKDSPCFFRQFWEIPHQTNDWEFLQTTVKQTQHFGGMEQILFWQQGKGILHERSKRGEAVLAGAMAWKRRGVIVSQMSTLPASLYFGDIFDKNAAVVLPKNESLTPAIWAFCSSPDFNIEVRKIDQALKVTNNTLVKIPFDLTHWQKVAAEKYPQGLPKPFSSDPTQWVFNGQPRGADLPLHVAVARLLGYQWPRQTGSSFADCPALGPDGLEELADDDGIMPISPAKGEGSAAERLHELLARAYGKDWNANRREELLTQVDYAGASLEDWLRNGFFEQHSAVFHHRPFIWHIWDGERDGFHALINCHKLASGQGRKALEKLTYAYLGDWIGRQRAEQRQGKEGADVKLAAALHLQDQLKNIIEGEPPYDLFIRWKPLHEQAIGWDPDINDGVRMNIRPFMMAETLNGKSIFRRTPKIKWEKDRGKEPERPKRDFPWFWSWDEQAQDFPGERDFDGNRWNDLHYSNKTKREARTRDEARHR